MTIQIPSVAAILAAFSLYQAVCWLLDRYNVGEKRKERKLLIEALMNMMRELIRTAHKDAISQGFIDEDELEHVEKIYNVYQALGGNGTGDRWMEELRQLRRA